MAIAFGIEVAVAPPVVTLEEIASFVVSFNSRGGSSVPSQVVDNGGYVAEPAAPVRFGYTFGGWYREEACTTPWAFATDAVTESRTLYAKWTIIIYHQGDTVRVPVGGLHLYAVWS